MTTITTRQGKGSALTYEEMDTNLTNLNEDKLETSGGTLSGNLTFANAGEGVVFADATSITSADGLGKTYNISAETATGGANLRLTDGTITDDVKIAGSGATTVTRTDADTITISSTDTNTTYTAGTGLSLASTTFSHADTSSVANVSPTSRTYVSGITFDTFGHVQTVSTATETVVDTNTTYAVSAETATGGANLRLTGSDATTDDVKIAGGTGITVSRTDASTITITNTGSLTETDPVVGAVSGIVKADGAGNISAAIAGTDYLASYTETDPVVGAITGIVKSDGAGNISAAVAGTDYLASYTETDPVVGAITGLVKANGAGNISAAVAGTDYIASESDPVVGAITGIVKADGAGTISAAVPGTDYLVSYTETDPVFSASPAAGITSTNITNWDTAYGWGDHSTEGYLKNIVEDTTPQLGANLDAQSYSITNVDIVQTDGVQLDTAAAETSAVGKLIWNAGKETVSVGLNTNCDMNIGQHNFIYGKATENIAKGQVVMFAGVQGDHILVALADATATGFVPEWIIGIAADTVVTNDFLHITILGEVTGIDTATNYNEGDILWFDPATPGGLTATEPEAPNAKIRMAAVTKEDATEGILLVRVRPSKSLGDLNDVVTAGATDNDFLIYNSTAGRWEHTPLDISLDTTPTLGGELDANSQAISNPFSILGVGSGNSNYAVEVFQVGAGYATINANMFVGRNSNAAHLTARNMMMITGADVKGIARKTGSFNINDGRELPHWWVEPASSMTITFQNSSNTSRYFPSTTQYGTNGTTYTGSYVREYTFYVRQDATGGNTVSFASSNGSTNIMTIGTQDTAANAFSVARVKAFWLSSSDGGSQSYLDHILIEWSNV